MNGLLADVFPEKFDGIVATEIIEHVENTRNFIRQCRKLLNPGGKLFLTTPNIDSAMAKAIFIRSGQFPLFTDRDYAQIGHITPILRWVLEKALTEAGFRATQRESVVPWDARARWWRMWAFAALLKRLAPRGEQQGQTLCIAAEAID